MTETGKNLLSTDIQINKNLPTLVSFVICPFVQRSVITFKTKNSPFDLIHIDLSEPPEWFIELVPTAKVPALLFNDDVLFESAVINEYIDENDGQRLQEKSHWERAQERAWINFVDELIFDQYAMLIASNEKDYEIEKDKFISKLLILGNKTGKQYFSNDSFGLLDAAAAPVFTRLMLTPSIYEELKLKCNEQSDLINWIENLIQLKAVKESVVEDFEEQFFSYFDKLNSYIISKRENIIAA